MGGGRSIAIGLRRRRFLGSSISDISTVGFGKVLSFSSTPRIVQFALKFSF